MGKSRAKYYYWILLIGVCLTTFNTVPAQPPLPSVDDGSIVVPISGAVNLIVVLAATLASLQIFKKREL